MYARRSDAEIDAQKAELSTRVDARIQELATAVDQARASVEIQQFLTFMSRFHTYSACNQWLIWVQKPEATRVAGFQTWKSMGRFPKKGTHGIKIWAPSVVRVSAQDLQDGIESALYALKGFHLTTVFDVADTDGEPLPDIAHYWIETDEAGEGLYKALWQVAEARGIKVSETHLGQAAGVSKGGAIEIDQDSAMLRKACAAAHEIAHELLHQHNDAAKDLSRELKELEAESVAYVVCSHFGYQVKCAEYIALWKGDSKAILGRLDSIRHAASTIIKEIEHVADAD